MEWIGERWKELPFKWNIVDREMLRFEAIEQIGKTVLWS